MGRYRSKDRDFKKGLMYSLVAIVNNTVLYTWKLLRVDLNLLSTHKKELTLWGDRCVSYLDFGNHPTMCVCVCVCVSSLCRLKRYTTICVNYASGKPGEEKACIERGHSELGGSYSTSSQVDGKSEAVWKKRAALGDGCMESSDIGRECRAVPGLGKIMEGMDHP